MIDHVWVFRAETRLMVRLHPATVEAMAWSAHSAVKHTRDSIVAATEFLTWARIVLEAVAPDLDAEQAERAGQWLLAVSDYIDATEDRLRGRP